MAAPKEKTTIFFDLDKTLFDHMHSVKAGIEAILPDYPELSNRLIVHKDTRTTDRKILELANIYANCQDWAYDTYLDGKFTYQEKEILKVHRFFDKIDQHFPTLNLRLETPKDVRTFRQKYQAAYRASRRAFPGSIEALKVLKEKGYQLAIITKGQKKDQYVKADQIGVEAYMERIFTSQEIGAKKPDRKIFDFALDALGASASNAYMVGDSLEDDVEGALAAGIQPVLFDPVQCHYDHIIGVCRDVECSHCPVQTQVIHNMLELLGVLDIERLPFAPKLCHVAKRK